MPTAPYAHVFKGDEPIFELEASPTSSGPTQHPPSLNPLDLGQGLLQDRRPNRGRRKSSFGHAKRPSISAPNSFRRVEYTDGQRASLIPLRLGPVVLSESPPPERSPPMTVTETIASRTRNRSDSTQDLLSDTKRESYRAQRDTPFQRCQQRGSTTIESPSSPSGNESDPPYAPPALDQSPMRAPLTIRTSSNSLRRQAMETSATSALQRLSNERTRLKRKRSLQSMRKPYAESGDMNVDKEILELNTIVEERRTDAARSRALEHHIPAVAPALQLHTRSETLNDIGSIFARPLTAREPARLHVFDSPEKPARPFTSRAASRTSSRVSGWLSGLLPTASVPAGIQEPFYKCVPPARPRAHSQASLCTSVTELESPSLTAASSPTSKGHSRSLTAESRLTPLSPQSAIYSHELPDVRKDAEEHWPIVTARPSQVGLAI
ncbi:hypothetical protein LTR85_007902 [Meristemomyces frigidus]|nr:hypothetical protein LTR85_007902 [Meristemomyces frigidus]